MTSRKLTGLLATLAALFAPLALHAQAVVTDSTRNIVDEVIWIVGDEAILKSEVETMRIYGAQEGMKWFGDPDCSIPEQLAVQKLFLHQAAIDSIEVTDNEVASETERRIEMMAEQVGSLEKLEEYRKQTLTQIRASMHDELRDQFMTQRMKEKLVEDIAVTPAEVRRYFRDMPADSIPFVPTEVEVQIITQTPRIEIEEVNRVKERLRDFTDRVTRGETTFQTLARLYSEDPNSARQGGEMDYMGRAVLDPAFAAVAFNLTDPKKISKVVESEFGYHIIQLVDKRGDKIKVRHILLKPQVSDESVQRSMERLDSIVNDIREEKFSFDMAASLISDDKDTRNNRGLMSTDLMQTGRQTSRFRMQELPPEVARAVDTLQVGQISRPFTMINKRGKTVCVVAMLKSRTEGHKADITADFQVLRDVVLEKRRNDRIHDWVVGKIKRTYVRLNPNYTDCKFEYEGWLK